MLIKTRFKIYFGIVIVIAGFLCYSFFYGIAYISRQINLLLPQAISDVQKTSRLDTLAHLIVYQDEVLTQSARNYSFTGDKMWRERYFEFVPKLDSSIKEAIEEGGFEDKKIFSEIDSANIALVVMEEQSINYADDKKLTKAQEILDSEEYLRQKDVYKKGIEKYLFGRQTDFDFAQTSSTKSFDEVNSFLKRLIISLVILMISISIYILFVVVVFYRFTVNIFMKPLWYFKNVAKEITKGNYNSKVLINNNDEIGDFAKDFNEMTRVIKESIENIEEKIKKRTLELEKVNKYLVGRELKMIELKKEIENLKKYKK